MQKNHLKQDFETYQKCIRDFKTKPKFSETHIFFTYIVPFYTPLEDVFHKGFQLWGGGGGGLLWGLSWGLLPQTCQP